MDSAKTASIFQDVVCTPRAVSRGEIEVYQVENKSPQTLFLVTCDEHTLARVRLLIKNDEKEREKIRNTTRKCRGTIVDPTRLPPLKMSVQALISFEPGETLRIAREETPDDCFSP